MHGRVDADLALSRDDLGKVEAVSIDDGCMDANGFIVWDKMKPAHLRHALCPTASSRPMTSRPVASGYDGRDAEFRAGEDWRNAYRSVD
jgi:hypothetical protein